MVSPRSSSKACSYALATCPAKSARTIPQACGSFQTRGLRLTCWPPLATQTRITSIAFGSSSAAGGISNSFSFFIISIPSTLGSLMLLPASCGLRLLPCRWRVLYPFIKPRNHLPKSVFSGFSGQISVSFIRQLHVTHDAAVAFNRLIHALALDRKSARVIVCHAVDQQDRVLDLVGLHKGRDLYVHFRGFPDCPAFALEAKGCQSPVISSTAGDSGPEQIRMRQQIGSHKSAVTVSAHAYALWIGHAHFNGLVDSGFGAGHNLLHISIVHGFRIADHRHSCVIQDGVTLQIGR